jgi:2-oxoisovalerate dehydrogenase E1 component alpha subunit
MGGHSTSDDPNAYRRSEALEPWAERDPIELLRRYLVRSGAWEEGIDKAIVSNVERRFKAAVEQAEQTPKPRLETMFEDVYQTPPWHLAEECEQVLRGPRPRDH